MKTGYVISILSPCYRYDLQFFTSQKSMMAPDKDLYNFS